MIPGHPAFTAGHRGGSRQPQITAIRDNQACIPLNSLLQDDDILLVLSPVVVPLTTTTDHSSTDPFEPFGRALASRHPWIRHVPYTARNGITETHVEFIKRAKAIIFIASGASTSGQLSQVDIAQASRNVSDDKPFVVIACAPFEEVGVLEVDFPTVVQLSDYLPADLSAAAAMLFGEMVGAPVSGVKVQELIMTPESWSPEDFKETDVTPIHNLWNQCLPDQFHMEKYPLQNLLQRDGYSMHFVVRLPASREIIGFCATYATFVDKAGERLIGSLAMLIVKSPYRRRGVGLSLYEHAVRQLKKIRGVDRIQLGSTYPRLLSGIPAGLSSVGWFQRRGWLMDGRTPGRGQHICDWLLKVEDWPHGGFSAVPSGLSYRVGTFDDFQPILDFVERETSSKGHTGWFDQYMNHAHDGRLNDIVLGLDRTRIVATALVYTPHEGSMLALDLPWARTIGSDVGGVTCICIADDCGSMTSSKDTVMVRLLDACITVLRDQGMQRVYLDAITGGDEGFQSMGFQKWAIYSDNWHHT
ncbi:hypothetical protein F5Y18DRAFT_209277 [Xylariaceae sp. FL1019]|nr:hypothetical protein F5Y18DRAFT_209277 [Xylariaceae sp. FL1019]